MHNFFQTSRNYRTERKVRFVTTYLVFPSLHGVIIGYDVGYCNLPETSLMTAYVIRNRHSLRKTDAN